MPIPADILREALHELKHDLTEHTEIAVNQFEERTGLSIARIEIQMHELSALPHPLYAVKAVDVEIATE